MRIRFWGTRGSLARPGPTTLRYGGNTLCVEVRTADGTLIVFDCGTGAYDLGQSLLKSGESPLRGHLLITHTHWDHIQGFPFFAPLFIPGNEWDIYAPGGLGQHLDRTLAGQMEYTYFPVTLNQLGATIRYHDLVEDAFDIGDIRVIPCYLNHPVLTLGYRLEVGGVTMVYATDHEPHSRHQPDVTHLAGAASRALPVHPEDLRHVKFLAGADLVIHDSQYTAEEYPKKVGWGHTSAEQAVDFALEADAKQLAIFHHDPLRDDDSLDRLVEVCRQRAATGSSTLEVFAAAEGQIIELPERKITMPHIVGHTGSAAVAGAVEIAAEAETVLIVDDDPDVVRLLIETLRPEGFHLLSANNGESALQIAQKERPALILLDWLLPGRDGLEVCRLLRADADPRLRAIPVVVLTSLTREEDITAAFEAGATDYLTKPFSPANVRARVRGWLLRSHTGAT
ncbi:MAG: response regulator [Candidatus Tectomicrobia bacterium]|nr:response regulator [Candidatus Tectomicrobia bacterium]